MYNIIVMNRTFDFSIGEYFHGYNRGVDKRVIFLDKQDYERFVKLLYEGTKARPWFKRLVL
jgi:hypothetical protein